jgi:branched-chain amino acid transport system substrate-binding protein
MRANRGLAFGALALAALAFGAAGCGSGDEPVRIGVLTDCQGPFRAFEDAQLSGAELPFINRGARLAGAGPSSGVTSVTVAGREVELVRGCSETGEHTVYIEEARRLVETEHVDAVVGGASVITREVARRYPDVPFLAVFWTDQEVTLRRPAANLYRFLPDSAEEAAGLGTYAFRTLGWRRAVVLANDGPPGWTAAAAFTAEFCALGGQVVRRVYSSSFTPDPPRLVERALAPRADGIASFLTVVDPAPAILGQLTGKLQDPARRLLLWSETLEDGATLPALQRKLAGVVSTTWLPGGPPSPRLREHQMRYQRAFPALPAFFGSASFVLGFHDAVEALLVALERTDADLSDGRSLLRRELASLRLPLPGGTVRLDANRQAVRDMSLSRITPAGLEPVRRIPAVEQTFGGLLSSAPPPGPHSQPCRKATPPPWAR